MKDIVIREFNPEKATKEKWEKFHTFNEEVRMETHPKDKLPNRESFEKFMKIGFPDFQATRWLVFNNKSEEEIIASCSASNFKKDSAMYLDNKEIGFISLVVRKGYRRQGLGSKLLLKLVLDLKNKNCKLIKTSAILESGRDFCEKYGAKLTNVRVNNRLYVSDINWNMINQWIKEGKEKNPNVSLETFHIAPEENIQEYCELLTVLENEVPSFEVEEDRTKEIFTPKRYREYEELLAKQGSEMYTIRTIEEDGHISGMTEIYYSKENNTERVNTGFTGVKHLDRGRGLGKLLKASMMLYVRDNLPETEYIATGNAEHNAPMLSINNRLGFKPYYQQNSYKFEIDDLIEKLNQ